MPPLRGSSQQPVPEPVRSTSLSAAVDRRFRGREAGTPLGLLRGILGSVSDGVIAVDAQGRFTLFNSAAERILGLGPQEVEPAGWADVYGLRQADGSPVAFERLPLARAMRGETVLDEAVAVSRPGSGTAAALRMSAWPLPGPMGRRGGAVAIFRDATPAALPASGGLDRVRVEAATFKALHEVAVAVCGELAPEALGHLVVDSARTLLAADAAAIALVDERDDELHVAQQTLPSLPGASGAARVALESRRPVVIEDLEPPVATGGQRHHRGHVAVPLIAKDRALGVLSVFSRRRRHFTEDEVHLLSLLAEQVAPAIAAARLYGHVSASEHRYRQLHATLSCGVVVTDHEGIIVERNEAAARICGVPQGVLRGPLSLRLTDPRDEHGQPIDYDDRPVQVALTTARAVRDRTISYRCPDGRRRWLLTRCAPVTGRGGEVQAVLSFVDVSELKEAERNLAQSQSQLQRVISNAPVMLFAVDRDGRLTFAQGQVLARSGLVPAELAGNLVADLLPGNQAVAEHLKRALAGAFGTLSATVGDRNFEIVYGPVRDAGGDLVGVSGVAVDVTDRHHWEQARKESEAKSQFLAGMSHELRTPLNAVLGFAQLLETGEIGPLNERQERYVRHILSSGRHLLDLVNDVLDLSKVAAGQLDLDVQPVDVAELCEQVTSELQPIVGAADLSLALEVPQPVRARADRRRLAQVLRNLLSNAVKFSEPGGRVVVDARRVGDRVVIRVSDTGIGIPDAYFERIFEEFGRVPGTEREGTGLGLPLTRSLVRLMDGTVSVVSEVGRGSTFTVELPAA